MTLTTRDEFAKAAMQAILTNDTEARACDKYAEKNGIPFTKLIAESAYEYADAMMAASKESE